MSSSAVSIPPRRSLAFFAALAMLMVVVSYVFILLLAAACVYLPFLALMRVSNFQILALFIGGVLVAGSMLWALVPRRDKFVAPGLLLERAHHPRLFAELDNIAAALKEPMPREVYLIGDTNAWVADRGGMMGFGSRRVMGLGLPLLALLNISQFRAILAHEFAHYYGGDTKLGPWLHRTQMAMIRTFQNMGSVGQAMRVAAMQILYAIVFGILKWYWLFFLRAINFVSRRQEFRADELACIVAGPQSLVSGLRTVHGASLGWPAYWSSELAPMLDSGFLPPITGGFSQFMGAETVSKKVEAGIETEIREGKSDPYDSHPPLRDRIAAAETLPRQSDEEEHKSAWTLLEDGSATEYAFLVALNPDMPKDSLKPVSWDEQGNAVVIPMWMQTVTEYAPLLQGMTIGSLFDSLGKVPEIAPKVRDPEGMLLTPEQRVERARSLLGSAVGLALVLNGWKLNAGPGVFHLDKDGERLDPFKVTRQLCDGTLRNDEWTTRCQKLGIGDIPLAFLEKEAASHSRQS
ncbi:MAG TPA: M48 family metallopeptidase [Terriglobales bacterium]|nr:M48 family metallopeptidase [Terriglobales bacterium]